MLLNPPIIVGIDGSSQSLTAVHWAAIDAARHQVPLQIVSAFRFPLPYEPGLVYVAADFEADRVFALENLEKASAVAHHAALDVVNKDIDVTVEALDAPPIPALLEKSKTARLMVVSTRGQGAIMRGLFGSVSSALIHHAHCPVAVIPEDRDLAEHAGPVVVGVDGSESGAQAVEIAFDEASRRKTGLVAVHAWDDYGKYNSRAYIEGSAEAVLAESLAGFAERYPEVTIHRVVTEGRPYRRILHHAEDAALLVVGSRGRGGFTGMLLGSTSNAVLHRAHCPVIVARD